MAPELALLAATAAGLGVLHALLGPDHYLPFVLMGRAGRWSRAKTLTITFFCGVGHVGSSLLLAAGGVALGVAVGRLQALEGLRGQVAVWALIAFGLVYGVWGLRRAARHRPHTHPHLHGDGVVHVHEHTHEGEHLHVHESGEPESGERVSRITPWVLFTVFIFGPCEPLIPLVLVPAAEQSAAGVALVAGVFSVATLATMLAAVAVLGAGVARLPLGSLERYTHALAGAALALCGVALQVFRL